MNKPISNLLTIWIPFSSLRRKARYHLIEFHPIRELLKRPRIRQYLEQKKKRGKAKVVIYSAVAGGYDDLRTHNYLSDEFDYVFFTDASVKGLHAWEIRPLTEFKEKSPVRKARYHKIFPDKLFPDYEYSVWIDGKYEIIGPDLERRIKEKISDNTLMASVPHPDRDCIYDEAELCRISKKDDPEVISMQIEFLKKEGYPKNNGLCDTAIIFRKHHDPKIKNIMNDWWNVLKKYSFRDQLSFGYALWKNNFKIDYLFSQSDSPSPGNNKDFIFHFHKR